MWDKLGWLNWLWQFLCEELSSFNPKRFYYSYTWSSSLCKRRTCFCTRVVSRKLCRFLCFRLALLHSVPYFFSLYRSPSSSLCTIFYSISSNLDEVLSINPTAVFVFGDFSIHCKDWLTYSSRAGRPGELGYNFSISNDKTRYSVSSRTLRLFSCWLGWSSWSLERCSWEDNFKLSASAAASEYCEWVQVVINVVKPHLSAWFSAGCAAAIVHRNHFSRLYYRINLLNLKWSSDRLIIVAKGLLKLQNLHMLLKLKNPSLPRNLALKTFGELLTVFSTKVNLRPVGVAFCNW